MEGNPNDYSSKLFGAFFMPAFAVILYFILRFVPNIDPRKKNYESFGKVYSIIRLTIAIFFLGIYFVAMDAAQTNHFALHSKFLFAGIFLLFVVLGHYMPTIKPNWFVGIRTPWTMENEEVWKKTHELGGKYFFFGGIIGVLLCALLPDDYSMIAFFVLMIIITFVPIVFSYLEFKRIKKRDAEKTS
jgi:uncharacterized membrane protein